MSHAHIDNVSQNAFRQQPRQYLYELLSAAGKGAGDSEMRQC